MSMLGVVILLYLLLDGCSIYELESILCFLLSQLIYSVT